MSDLFGVLLSADMLTIPSSRCRVVWLGHQSVLHHGLSEPARAVHVTVLAWLKHGRHTLVMVAASSMVTACSVLGHRVIVVVTTALLVHVLY